MYRIILFLMIWVGVYTLTFAQDAYHTQLANRLQTQHTLTGGDWVFYDTEADIIGNATLYGGVGSSLSVTGQDFNQIARMVISSPKSNAFGAGWNIRNKTPIQQGEKVLLTFYLRAVGAPGKVNVFMEDAVTYAKEIFLTAPVDTSWRLYYIPFEAQNSYAVDALSCGFHLGALAQTIEIGGYTAIKFGSNVPLSQFPNQTNNEFYGGWEANAPWRAAAAQRIDSLRKTDLTILAIDQQGNPIENGAVKVQMIKHEFAFGSAITADQIANNNRYNRIYENKIIDLDGKGHGFNWVVFENDMKWPAWEDEWLVNKTELIRAVDWLRAHDIPIRGHNLLWPGSTNLPSDINANLSDIPYIKNRVFTHIDQVLTYPGIPGQVPEWDVINEIITNRTLEDAFRGTPGYPTGREFYAEVFAKAHATDSTLGLYLNDYITLSQQQEAGNEQYDNWKAYVQELVNADVGLSGLGFQGHIGGFPNGIPSVLSTWDDFYNAFGLTAKVTEFDLPSFVTDSLGAVYLKDFMTATFSHPSMDGFLFWNFWDGSTWLNSGCNLFNLDWTRTPACDTFVSTVFDQWWTEEDLLTDLQGEADVRGFKGEYEIVYTCQGLTVRDTIWLSGPMTHTITCDQLATNRSNPNDQSLSAFPNPAQDRLWFEGDWQGPVHGVLFDSQGKEVYAGVIRNQHDVWDISAIAQGVYTLRIEGNGRMFYQRLLITP